MTLSLNEISFFCRDRPAFDQLCEPSEAPELMPCSAEHSSQTFADQSLAYLKTKEMLIV